MTEGQIVKQNKWYSRQIEMAKQLANPEMKPLHHLYTNCSVQDDDDDDGITPVATWKAKTPRH
jgi:hypothetical protein